MNKYTWTNDSTGKSVAGYGADKHEAFNGLPTDGQLAALFCGEPEEKPVIQVCCPFCHAEQFMVVVNSSGSGFNYSVGAVERWFEGEGTCLECGHTTWHWDSSL